MSKELPEQFLSNQILPSSFLDYRQYLASVYAVMKDSQSNRTYSYQKFASDLGFGPTTVIHQIVKGYRPLSQKAAEKIVKALNLKGSERRYFLKLVDYCNAKRASVRDVLLGELIELKNKVLPNSFDKDCLDFFSEWFHPVIHELVGFSDFKYDPEWIGNRLQPKPRSEEIVKSLELLERLELIRFDATSNRWIQTNKRISTGHRVKGLAFVAYHKKMIEMASDSISQVSSEKRDISALTLSIDEKTFKAMQAMIHAFQMQLLDLADSVENPDRVCNVNIQLFPFTGE
jgi:uncharacterized protein (TIGR02147 family)